MNRLFKLTVLIMCLCVTTGVVQAQQKCSLQTLAGTYALFEKGSSLMLNPASAPEILPFFSGAVAPFVNVAEITFTADGVGDGFFWLWVGQIRPIVDATPVHLTVTEMNEDCTGKVSYTVNLPGGRSALVEERFLVLDEGREFRTVPISIQNGTPLMSWLGVGHRVNRDPMQPNFCGQQTAFGRYLMSCENIVVRPSVSPYAISDAFQLAADVSMSGDYTGTLYERLGEKGPMLQVSGKMIVNPDCSFSGTLDLPSPPFKGSIIVKGMYYDDGKNFHAMGILNDESTYDQQGIRFSACQGTRMGH